ncbi:MAG: DUF4444 domain-containing protein [Pseudomonadota bacterium]
MTLTFPPLMHGQNVDSDAFLEAVRRATLGCDAGLVTYAVSAEAVEAALVFTPDVPLDQAMAMLPLCAVGFQNALGSLGPPEVAVHLDWDGTLRVNGARCGTLRAAANTTDPDTTPDWLVIGFQVPLLPDREDMGAEPDRTVLYAEGCADVLPGALVESWARHTLHWINRWESDGLRALHAEWRGLAHGVGEPTNQSGQSGTYMGVDENFGMLLRDDDGATHLIPLTTLLEAS